MSQISIEQGPAPSLTGSLSTSASLQQPEAFGALKGSRWRIAMVLVLFLLQGLALTVCFDAAVVTESSATWAKVFRFVPLVPRIAISLLVALPFLTFHRLRDHFQGFASATKDHQRWWIWYLCQWAAFASLFVVSAILFDSQTVDAAAGPIWAILWATLVIACGVSLLCSLAPLHYWLPLARQERWTLLTSVAIALCATFGGPVFQLLWYPLGDCTFNLVEFWLSFIYSETIVSDAGQRILGTQTFNVHIAPQCSGYEGIGLISIFVLGFLAVFRKTLRFPQAWLLWPIGVVLIWICNSLRIAALIVIGTEYSSNLALGGFHSQAGWIMFNCVSIGLMAGALQCGFFTKTHASQGPRQRLSTAPYLAPFLVLTALSMIMAAVTNNAAMWYPLVVIVSACVLWTCRDLLGTFDWSCSTQAVVQGLFVYVVWTALALLTPPSQETSSLPNMGTIGGLSWTMFRVIGAVIAVPIIEELAFRGFLLRRLVRSEFETVNYQAVPIWAVIVSALAFGMMHQLWLGGIVAGLSYGALARRRGHLGDPIYAHAITNGLLAVTVLSTGATWLW